MAPRVSKPERSAENEDMLIITKQFEALKMLDGGQYGRNRNRSNMGNGNGTGNGTSSSSSSEPRPEYVFSKSVSFWDATRSNGNGGIFGNWTTGDGNNNSRIRSNSTRVLQHIQKWTSIPMDESKESHTTASHTATLPSSFDTGPLINKEMLKYNLNERNAIYEEIHGVGSLCPEESDEMIEAALKDLEREMEALPSNQKVVYEQSHSRLSTTTNDSNSNSNHQNKNTNKTETTYIHGRDFKLRFLRAELFDAHKAACRMALFLETLLDLFGPQVLERPVNLSDFSKKEMKVLNAGRLQLLPYRDRGGRRVLVGIPSQDHSRYEALTRSKIHFYLWWIASESVETQRKGLVFVTIHNPAISDATSPTPAMSSYDNDNDQTADHGQTTSDQNDDEPHKHDISGLPSMEFAKFYVTRRNSKPVRMVACHVCTPDTPFYNIVRSFNAAMLGTDERCRMKIHVGQDIENRYQLNGFGIPLDQLPITESGKIKITHFKKWVQLRKNIEDPNPDSHYRRDMKSIVECPGLNDVVFRPSQSTMCHPGNVMFRGLVESKHFEHSIAPTREAKIEITKGVISEVKKRGGRFLAWNNLTWWTELTDERLIYSKIAVFFRNSKVSAKAKSNHQSMKSSTYMFTGADNLMDDKRRKIECECFSFGLI